MFRSVTATERNILALLGDLREAWQRYETPVAISEVHLNCTREEQVRWFMEAWNTASGSR